jgi:hypothetical protein
MITVTSKPTLVVLHGDEQPKRQRRSRAERIAYHLAEASRLTAENETEVFSLADDLVSLLTAHSGLGPCRPGIADEARRLAEHVEMRVASMRDLAGKGRPLSKDPQ